jgi:DNA-binding winged helix-turn-helix (wHTH) protein/tetratricopeptide (TPR) repeat protein
MYEMNLDTQELSNAGTLVKLAPQPFKLLEMLASNAGQIVSREDIQKQLWGEDTFVDFERGVHKCINQIRNVLNDSAERPLYVETVPRRGYRFLAPVTSKNIAVVPKVRHSGPVDPETIEQYTKPVLNDEDSAPVEVRVGEKGGDKTRFRRWGVRLLWVGVTLAALAGGRYLYRRFRPPLTDKDTIVLSDFDNNTGDSVFDGTLRQGLQAALEQSPFLNMLSEQRIRRTLVLIGVQKGAPLTPTLVRDVCVRNGSAATIEGAIARLGTQYVLSLKAVNCLSGDELAVEQVTAENKEKVLPALGKAASHIRQKLGESRPSLQQHNTPLEDVTTPSLEALQAYSLALRAASTNGPAAALSLYKRAVELDPNFALAYMSLAVEYANLNQPGRASENARKAYDLRARVSEKERLYIEAYYRLNATGELEKAVQVFEAWQQAFPREYWPYGMLSDIYMTLGNWEKVLTQSIGAMQLAPDNNIGYVNGVGAYLALNRFEEAGATLKKAEELRLRSEDMLLERYQLAFLTGDTARMTQVIVSDEVQAGVESTVLALQGDTEAWYGKLRSARDYTKRAVDSAERNDAKEAAGGFQAVAALREVEFGDWQQGKNMADAAMQPATPNRDVQAMAALAQARAADTAKADNLAAALDNAFPLDTLVQKYWLPAIRAAVALQHNRPNDAIELLKPTEGIELGQPIRTEINTFLYPVYLRGEAYLMLNDGNAAAAEFQKYIDHRGVVGNNPLGALARLGLARAYGKQGDTAKARAAYQEFLTIWKDADSNIPIYQQARAEYSTLKDKN